MAANVPYYGSVSVPEVFFFFFPIFCIKYSLKNIPLRLGDILFLPGTSVCLSVCLSVRHKIVSTRITLKLFKIYS